MPINLHISISAEPLFHIGGLAITNSILTSVIVTGLILTFAVVTNRSLITAGQHKKVSTLQNMAEFLVEWLYGLIQSVTNSHSKTRLFLPLIISYFVFILCNNWFGLIPGVGTIGFKEKTEVAETVKSPESSESPAHSAEVFIPYFRAGTADLNTTIALALITAISAQYWGIRYLHLNYFKKFFNFKSVMGFFVGILELVSEFSKILSYSFRLFGNIFAGEVLLIVMGALVPLGIPMVFYGLEIFVGAIQALVFSLLSIIFYQVATIGHDEEHTTN
jgi:F-type H+-transporting ATPase subunit a